MRLLVEHGVGFRSPFVGDGPAWSPGDGRTPIELALGADPNLRDQRFGATPLDWARHFHQPATAALLEPITSPPASE